MGYAKESTYFRVNNNLFIDASLQELTQSYLNNEQIALNNLKKALENKDFNTLFTIGDQLYGHGYSFGFPVISELGKNIELAATARDFSHLNELIGSLSFYLDNINIVYL
ncbi:MAG: hypothetical protein HY819_00245 [Acidobacteria bacterium]|nr:hypothetical protein [Acidobacteriota bacterium]